MRCFRKERKEKERVNFRIALYSIFWSSWRERKLFSGVFIFPRNIKLRSEFSALVFLRRNLVIHFGLQKPTDFFSTQGLFEVLSTTMGGRGRMLESFSFFSIEKSKSNWRESVSSYHSRKKVFLLMVKLIRFFSEVALNTAGKIGESSAVAMPLLLSFSPAVDM